MIVLDDLRLVSSSCAPPYSRRDHFRTTMSSSVIVQYLTYSQQMGLARIHRSWIPLIRLHHPH